MKTLYLIIVVAIVFIDCGSQKRIVNEKKEKEFLKWIIEQQNEKEIYERPIELTMEKVLKLKEEISFSRQDSIDIKKQIEVNNEGLHNVNLASERFFIKDTTKESSYLKITKPIFFNSRKKYGYTCNIIVPVNADLNRQKFMS